MIRRGEKKSIRNLIAFGLTCVLANIESRPLDERDVKKPRKSGVRNDRMTLRGRIPSGV